MSAIAEEATRVGYFVDHTSANRILKRAIDIVAAILVMVVFAPVVGLITMAILVTSPGRVTFKQARIGRNGELFHIMKFRSMVPHAEKILETDPELRRIYLENDHKIPAELDTRITKLGRFLRATSLDELPQVWNILWGHMSLVGPRPVVPSEIQKYGEYIPIYESVRPGLTGPWQASGRSTLPFHERALLDVDYVTNWKLSTDIKLLFKTVPAVLLRHGAH